MCKKKNKQQNNINYIPIFHRLWWWTRREERDRAGHRAFGGHGRRWLFFTRRFSWGTNQTRHLRNHRNNRLLFLMLFCLCHLIFVCLFVCFTAELPKGEMEWGKCWQSTQWKVRFYFLDVHSSDLRLYIIYIKTSWLFVLNQQLPADECWAARRWWNHVGKRWTANWKHELKVKRW